MVYPREKVPLQSDIVPGLTVKKDVSKRGDYKWDTYLEVLDEVKKIGTGTYSYCLACAGQYLIMIFFVNCQKKKKIGLAMLNENIVWGKKNKNKNRPEWMYVHLANWSQNYRTVALYDTLGSHAVEYIVSHAELPVIFVEKDKLPKLWDAIEHNKKKESDTPLVLKYVIQFDFQERFGNKHESVRPEDLEIAKNFGITLLGLTELENVLFFFFFFYLIIKIILFLKKLYKNKHMTEIKK
ncbi:hypothetical protein RFI_16821 [Reticulomyxa filosa]|uniref:AMP-dependent synthetase/ligase domain-containing protein n=1 Tax=Reticulomyxa filosa TaxID=46433 RepID=X6N2X4_RETFI|nr:hypothetical protein RFI_16821 [Reticulomyxa filosa]|eukprot:ETO20396.1 hypothetical protein RFI_16821 [Reticulomyxa filosa]